MAPEERSVRFGCGFLFGMALVIPGLLSDPLPLLAGVSGISGVVCGVLAVRKGDRFWRWLADHRFW